MPIGLEANEIPDYPLLKRLHRVYELTDPNQNIVFLLLFLLK